MNTRRKFLTTIGTLGVFTILPGAGRIWKVQRPAPVGLMEEIRPFQDWLNRRLIMASEGFGVVSVNGLRGQSFEMWIRAPGHDWERQDYAVSEKGRDYFGCPQLVPGSALKSVAEVTGAEIPVGMLPEGYDPDPSTPVIECCSAIVDFIQAAANNVKANL